MIRALCFVLPLVLPAADTDPIMDALSAELDRALTLKLDDLPSPYFVSFDVADLRGASLMASYGATYGDREGRARHLTTTVRVGAPDLDNTHFLGGGRSYSFFSGGMQRLPLEDDPEAIRHAAWLAADQAYKEAVETLTRKRAYLEDKTIAERPADFSPAAPAQHAEPSPAWDFDRAAWKARLEGLSRRFRDHDRIQDSSVTLQGATSTRWLASTEGTRLRTASTGWTLTLHAEAQAADGMRLQDSIVHEARTPAALPSDEALLADIDMLAARLAASMDGDVLESYTGPVLFEGEAAAQVLRVFLADKLAANPDPIGQERPDAGDDLQKKLGQSILPRGFSVVDDPTLATLAGRILTGHYAFDDEGVPAARVELVQDGRLATLLLSRSPTRKLSGSNGHGRRAMYFGAPQASIANLVFASDEALPEAELRARLLEAAQEAGLDHAVVVTRLQSDGGASQFRFFFGGGGGGGGQIELPEPLHAVRLDADGSEHPVRGCQFGATNLRALRDILAAGDGQHVNAVAAGPFGGGGSTAVVAPSLLFEELELLQIDQELDKLPILARPSAR